MQTVIRQLAPADASAFAELRLTGLHDSPLAFGRNYAEECERTPAEWADFLQNNFYLGALREQELIGIVGMIFYNLLNFKHVSTLCGLFVAEPYRRLGVAKLLVFAAEEAARERGVEQVCAVVTAGNPVTERFYTALGYVKYGTEPRAKKMADQYFDTDLYIKFL